MTLRCGGGVSILGRIVLERGDVVCHGPWRTVPSQIWLDAIHGRKKACCGSGAAVERARSIGKISDPCLSLLTFAGGVYLCLRVVRWRAVVVADRSPVTCLSVLGFLSMLSAAEGPSDRSAMGSVLSSDPALKAVLPMTRGFETCDQLAEIVADCRKQLESMQGWKVCKSALSACLVYSLALRVSHALTFHPLLASTPDCCTPLSPPATLYPRTDGRSPGGGRRDPKCDK